MLRKILAILFTLLLVTTGNSIVVYLTNGLVDIISLSKMLSGDVKYDPYRSVVYLRFGTNLIEFFENRDFSIINSNYIMPSSLVQTNLNYYVSLPQIDYIISILRLECVVSNYSTPKTSIVTQGNKGNPTNFNLETSIKENLLQTNTNTLQKTTTLDQTNRVENESKFLPIKFIIIDPGHGGKDPGAIHNGIEEKRLTLDFGKKIYESLLQISPKDIKIVLTRNNDVYLTLEDRVKIANNLLKQTEGYGIFVSIHMNASPIKSKKGLEIYFISDKAVDSETRETLAFENAFIESKELQLVSDLEKIIGKIRSVALMEESRILSEKLGNQLRMMNQELKIKGGPFYVIKYIPVPSILLEIGYISNPESAKLLSDPIYQSQISKAVAEGISDFISFYNKTYGFTFSK